MKKYLRVYHKGKHLNAIFNVENIPFLLFKKGTNLSEFKTSYKINNGVHCLLSVKIPNNIELPLFIKTKTLKINSSFKSIYKMSIKARVYELTYRDILNIQSKYFNMSFSGTIEKMQIEYCCAIPKKLLYKLNNISVKDFKPKKVNQYVCFNKKPYLGGTFSPK